MDNDKFFTEELKKGHQWQRYVADRIMLHGYDVSVPEIQVRKDIKFKEYWTEFDQDVLVEGCPIEVKSRSLKFTAPENFPYATVIIDTVSSYNEKETKPYFYICVSQITKHMIWISGTKSKEWTVERHFDPARNIHDNFYVANRKFWHNMRDILPRFEMMKLMNT